MNRSLLATIVMISVAALMACGGGDTGESREGLATTSSRLAVPSQSPIPVSPSTGQSWRGTPAELMFADAFASCAYLAPSASSNAPVTFKEDHYLQYIQAHMDTAVCRYQNSDSTWTDWGTSAAQAERRWLNQRNDPKCNVDRTTKANVSAALTNRMEPISIPVQEPFSGGYPDTSATTAAAATRAVTLPITNLCIAQHLRLHSPGGSAGEALLLSAADQRALLALTKERAQMAMLQFALLGRVFATARLSDAEAAAVSKTDMYSGAAGYPLSFIPMLQQWAQNGTATQALLRTLGQEFATAIQLHAVASHELVELLSRSGAARLARGASPSDPSWAATGRLNAAAVEMWGPGAWRERAMAALYGGDPLVEDTSGSTPWAHFLASKNPGDGGSETSTEWPDVTDASFVSTRIKDPKLQELYALASHADALYLLKTASWVTDPLSHYRCRDVDVALTYDQLYRATEAYVRTNQCSTYDPASNTCHQYVLADIPSSTDFATFELWQKYRITPEHASALTTWLKDIIAKECQRDRQEVDAAGTLSTTTITFWNRGALDFTGEIESSGASQEYYHLRSPELRPRVLRETAGLFSRYSGLWFAPQIYPEADPATEGFSVGAIAGASITGVPTPETNWPEEMRLMGAIPALAVTRDAIVKAAVDAAALPSDAQAEIGVFLEKMQVALAVIENEIGKDGISVTPAHTLATSNASITWNGMPVTLNRKVLAPTYASQNVEITYSSNDTFWSSTGTYTLFAIPDEPLATSVAAHPGSKAFGRDVAAILVNPRGQSGTLVASTPPPAGTVRSSAMHVTLPIPRSDEQWSYVVQRQVGTTIDYKPLVSHIRKFSLSTMNVGQYLAFNGALSDTAAGLLAKDLNDPTRPAFDGFGLPNAWMPPTDPALFGGATGADAAGSYLQKARASAQDATAAVKEAFESMLATQQDEAALAASVAKSAKVADLERSSLCGSSQCDTSVSYAPIPTRELWDTTVGRPRPTWDILVNETCKPTTANSTFAQMIDGMLPEQRLDCLATMILGKARLRPPRVLTSPSGVIEGVPMLSTVVSQRSAPAVPSFGQYAGGSLQAIAIQQWTSLRELEDRIRGLIAATDAAISTVRRYELERQLATDQEKEMDKRCGKLHEELTAIYYCRDDDEYAGSDLLAKPCGTRDRGSFDELTWEDEGSTSESWGSGTGSGTSAGFGASFFGFIGGSFGLSDSSSNSNSSTSTPMSLGAKRRLCQAYEEKVSVATWRRTDAVIQVYANIQERAAEFTSAVSRVRMASAAGTAMRHQTDLAVARSALEVDLLRDSQKTSFGLYRQLHSYDAWRAKALLDGARLSAAVARKAIESRYVVNLSELNKPEPLVASPSTWADGVYDYDLDMPSAVGLSVGDAVPGGIYSNKTVDYVSNLESFVNGYSIARPTAVMYDDAEVVSLPGPRGLDASAPAMAWSYFCPSGPNVGWRPSPPNMNPSEACGPAPNRPTRASVLFALDPWGRLHGDIAEEPFARRYNARWSNLAVNLVGTGVLDCSKAPDPGACYTQPFVRYQLSHRGVPWITDAEQSWTILPVPIGNIEGAKALAAEQWLDPIVNAWSKPFVASVARSELAVRPLGGSYEIEFNLGPEVVLERIQRVQLLVGTSYWVSQGQSPDPPPPISAPTIASLNYTQGDTVGGGQSIVITGTGLDSVTSCTFGGTPASLTAQTPTTLTVTLPAHAAGNVSVTVTGPGGSSGALSFEYWDPSLEPNAGVLLDSLSGVSDDGTYVHAWANRGYTNGGSGALVYQEAAGQRPTKTPRLTFDGVDDFLRSGYESGGIYYSGTMDDDPGGAYGAFTRFIVGSWTSADTTVSSGYGVPMTAISNAYLWAFGASADKISVYPTAYVSPFEFGAGFNDGQLRLLGIEQEKTNGGSDITVRAYNGQGLLGSHTWAGYGPNWYQTLGTIGVGYDNAGLKDPWSGRLAAIITFRGLIASSVRARLEAWAAQRFGVAL